MHLLVVFPSPWPAAFRKSVAEFFLHFPFEISIKNVRFGRSLAQLILGALSLYPFEFKEGPERRFLSDVPFGRFRLLQAAVRCPRYYRSTLSGLRKTKNGASLAMYPLVGFA